MSLDRRRDVLEAGGLRCSLDRGDVDVGGQILAADRAVGIVVDLVAEVRRERAFRTSSVVIEVGGRIAVVDEQDQALREPGGRRGDPGVDGEADLRPLALDKP